MNDVHAGDRVLNATLRELAGAYTAPRNRCEEILAAYLKPKIEALQRRNGETLTAWRRRLLLAFRGPRWALVKRKIAKLFTEASEAFTERVNDALEQAFVDGFNDSAYSMALSGAEAWPITLAIAASLISAGLLTLNRRTVNKRADIQNNEQRTQSAITASIMRGVEIEELTRDVARRFTHARQSDMTAYARTAIYGASDYGAYMAGIEAENAGIEVEKTWLAIMDMRVRPSHAGLHGDTVPLNGVFHGLYGDLRFPHDPKAPPEEIYRCRCRMAVHVAGKSPGAYSRFLMPYETLAYRKWRDRQIQELGGELELLKKHKKLVS